MNRHEELLAWWELGTELNYELERAGTINDPLEVKYAVDQLDEVGNHLLGTKISVISPYIEVIFNKGIDPDTSFAYKLIEGTLNGSYYSYDSPKGLMGAYLNCPVVDEDSDTVKYAFVPFQEATIVPEIKATAALHSGLVEYIDTLLYGEKFNIFKLVNLFNDERTMQNLIEQQAYIQYLNEAVRLDTSLIELVTSQAYVINRKDGLMQAAPIVEDGDSEDIVMPSQLNKSFKIYHTAMGKQLGIVMPTKDTDLFVPLLCVNSISITLLP